MILWRVLKGRMYIRGEVMYIFQALFDLRLLPPAAAVVEAVGARVSFLPAAVVAFFAAAEAVVFVAAAGCFFTVPALPFGAGFLTIVVPALLSLTPLLRSVSLAVVVVAALRVVCWRLAVLAPALSVVGACFAGLAGRTREMEGFSGDPPALKGERGRVREL